MKKIIQIVLASLSLFISMSVFAQDKDKQEEKRKRHLAQSYVEIAAGISAPFGNFSKTDYTNNKSGFASLGPVVSISGVKYIGHTNFGLGGTISYAQYGVKNLQHISDGYQNDFDVDSTNVHATKYTSVHVLMGPYYSIPLGIVTLDFHVLGGINAMTSPRITVLLEDGGNSYTYGNESYSFMQEASHSVVLATQLDAGLRISPAKHFAIAARVDYFYSQPVFNITNDNRTAVAGRLLDSYTQRFNGINATLGLVYQFGNR